MKIVNLIENTEGDSGCTPAHGLSFYVESNNHKLLVDLGPSEETIKNADALGIDLDAVDTVILSHGHYDHSGGILSFGQRNSHAKIYLQRTAFGEYYAYDGKELGYHYIGIDPAIAGLSQVVWVDGDIEIDEELSLFVITPTPKTIPSTNRRLMEKVGEEFVQDTFAHEQCLVVKEKEDYILFSGCAHNGINNIMECFVEKYGCAPKMAISGFHLMRKRECTGEEIREIKDLSEKLLTYPTRFVTCHCTGTEAYEIMKERMGDRLSYCHCGDAVNNQ